MTERELAFWEKAYLNGIASVRDPKMTGGEISMRAKQIADRALTDQRELTGLGAMQAQQLESSRKELAQARATIGRAGDQLYRFIAMMERQRTAEWEQDELQILYKKFCELLDRQSTGAVRRVP